MVCELVIILDGSWLNGGDDSSQPWGWYLVFKYLFYLCFIPSDDKTLNASQINNIN